MMICLCTSWTVSLVILLDIWSFTIHYCNSYQKKQLSLIFIHSHSFTLCYQDHRILFIECCYVCLCYMIFMIFSCSPHCFTSLSYTLLFLWILVSNSLWHIPAVYICDTMISYLKTVQTYDISLIPYSTVRIY